jgi:hypothetical protein
MEIPFSIEEFLSVFGAYNLAIQPIQLIAYGLGLLAVLFGLLRTSYSRQIILSILAAFWAWTGIVYHIVYFSEINKVAYVFGALFLLQAIPFLYAAFHFNKLRIQFSFTASAIIGALFIVYAMLVYPVLNYVLGHVYPKMPVFGVAPCPVTIFTFGLLLWVKEKVPLYLIVIPFLWSLIGVSAAIQLKVAEDYGLIVAGIVGATLIIVNNRRKTSHA